MHDPPPYEPLAPKISIRSMIGLVTGCALAMGILRHATSTGAVWAVLTCALIASFVLPILAYCATFALASLFSLVGSAAAGPERPQRVYTPTTEMDGPSRGDSNGPSSSDPNNPSHGDPAGPSHGEPTGATP